MGGVEEAKRDNLVGFQGSKDMATNRGFRMWNGQIVTYEQQKLGLSAY